MPRKYSAVSLISSLSLTLELLEDLKGTNFCVNKIKQHTSGLLSELLKRPELSKSNEFNFLVEQSKIHDVNSETTVAIGFYQERAIELLAKTPPYLLKNYCEIIEKGLHLHYSTNFESDLDGKSTKGILVHWTKHQEDQYGVVFNSDNIEDDLNFKIYKMSFEPDTIEETHILKQKTNVEVIGYLYPDNSYKLFSHV